MTAASSKWGIEYKKIDDDRMQFFVFELEEDAIAFKLRWS